METTLKRGNLWPVMKLARESQNQRISCEVARAAATWEAFTHAEERAFESTTRRSY